jgi:hypothetical protein
MSDVLGILRVQESALQACVQQETLLSSRSSWSERQKKGEITSFKCGQCEKSINPSMKYTSTSKLPLHLLRPRKRTPLTPLLSRPPHQKIPPMPPMPRLLRVSSLPHEPPKRVNASRYVEPYHYIALHHPSIPVCRPDKIWCLHCACKRSFPSKRQFECHGHADWEQPKGVYCIQEDEEKGKAV